MKKYPHTRALGRFIAVSALQFACIVTAVLLAGWLITSAIAGL